MSFSIKKSHNMRRVVQPPSKPVHNTTNTTETKNGSKPKTKPSQNLSIRPVITCQSDFY